MLKLNDEEDDNFFSVEFAIEIMFTMHVSEMKLALAYI